MTLIPWYTWEKSLINKSQRCWPIREVGRVLGQPTFLSIFLGGSTQMSLFWTLFWVNHSQEHPFSAPFWTLELFWTLFRGLKSWFALKNVSFSGFALSTAFLSAQTTYMALLAPLIWEICQFWVFFTKILHKAFWVSHSCTISNLSVFPYLVSCVVFVFLTPWLAPLADAIKDSF